MIMGVVHLGMAERIPRPGLACRLIICGRARLSSGPPAAQDRL
jgi:hypothetical protein